MLLVMGFLSRNILRDRSNVRFADAEYAISGLPGELNVSFFVYHRDEFVLITRAICAAE